MRFGDDPGVGAERQRQGVVQPLQGTKIDRLAQEPVGMAVLIAA